MMFLMRAVHGRSRSGASAEASDNGLPSRENEVYSGQTRRPEADDFADTLRQYDSTQ